MTYARSLRCVNCGEKYPIRKGVHICEDCGEEKVDHVAIIKGLLEVEYDYGEFTLTKDDLESRSDRTIWKFKEFLPVGDHNNIVSLGEGGTPLLHCRNLPWTDELLVKNEAMNPVGSFKDRGTSVMLSMAKEFGVETVTVASSGNAGGAVAAYSNSARIDAICFVPTGFSPTGKRATYAAYNPSALIGIKGYYEEAQGISVEIGQKYGWYLTNHGYNPYRMEGDKTTAYEICMDLDWEVPDHVLVPTGSGTNISGEWKGFRELYDLGWIDALPKMTAVQVEAGAPLVDAILNNKEKIEPYLEARESIADGIVSKYDDCAPLILQAIRESNGTAVAVSDKETLEAECLLASKEGLFFEPSTAVAFAGYQKLMEQGEIDPDERTVVVATATGLKDPDIILRDFKFPIELEVTPSTVNNVEEFLKKGKII